MTGFERQYLKDAAPSVRVARWISVALELNAINEILSEDDWRRLGVVLKMMDLGREKETDE